MKTPENATDNNVGRKTPKEIKNRFSRQKALYNSLDKSFNTVIVQRGAGKLYHYIELSSKQHERIQQLESRLAQAEQERDAALKDIANTCWSCRNAKPSQLSKFLYSCPHLKGKAGVRTQCENWQWRGVCPENTKEETK